MIIREEEGYLWLFRQTDHALLSGAFALAWGNDLFPVPERREAVLVAAARHDDGWADWELAPRLGPDGRPVDFIRVAVADHVALYRRGIDLVETEDPYAGLVVSLHGERLYTRPFHRGMRPRIEHLEGRDLELAAAHVAHERARQERLREDLQAYAVGAEEAWRLLQVWDRLSLFVCLHSLHEDVAESMPPVSTRRSDVEIEARAASGELILDPYPFGSMPCTFEVAAVRCFRTRWEHESDYRLDYRSAPRVVLRFTCRGP